MHKITAIDQVTITTADGTPGGQIRSIHLGDTDITELIPADVRCRLVAEDGRLAMEVVIHSYGPILFAADEEIAR